MKIERVFPWYVVTEEYELFLETKSNPLSGEVFVARERKGRELVRVELPLGLRLRLIVDPVVLSSGEDRGEDRE